MRTTTLGQMGSISSLSDSSANSLGEGEPIRRVNFSRETFLAPIPLSKIGRLEDDQAFQTDPQESTSQDSDFQAYESNTSAASMSSNRTNRDLAEYSSDERPSFSHAAEASPIISDYSIGAYLQDSSSAVGINNSDHPPRTLSPLQHQVSGSKQNQALGSSVHQTG